MDLDRSSVSRTLAAAGCISPDAEADELIAAAGGDGASVGSGARRSEGEPIAWLVGSVQFCDERFTVTPGVYVPRRQTEALARRASSLLSDEGLAVDPRTGSGAIAAVLRASVPSARVVATELDEAAVACALMNGVEVFPRVPRRSAAVGLGAPGGRDDRRRAVRADRCHAVPAARRADLRAEVSRLTAARGNRPARRGRAARPALAPTGRLAPPRARRRPGRGRSRV